jgi:catechol 2,3-dioxygenase-like lactoylglutathione lyase family enzyme
MIEGIRFSNITIDCPDEDALCIFYEALLGWERKELWGHPSLTSPDGTQRFLFMQEKGDNILPYLPPVWPEQPGQQQKQMHFDFQVPDVPAAVAYAESLGAKKAKEQFGGPHFTTMIDPAGHPFCLCAAE